jgi:putative GTP pyrophosphokinase
LKNGQLKDILSVPPKRYKGDSMPFSSVPSESKNRINKAGQILAKDNTSPTDVDWARDLAIRWRACHAYPINTFQATLRRKLTGVKGDPIVAQRLKRMPTIIDKLRRYPAMQLTTMQDIGGVRAVLDSVGDVYKLAAEYKNKSRFAHELIDEKDYIENPRSEDGYRSLHLIYKYKNSRNPQYDGLRLELQIRTKLQHTWATAVETMGTFLGQALKSRQGDQEWIDFFAVTSSAFAYKENTPTIPRYGHLSQKQASLAVADADTTLRALEKMSGFSVAVNNIPKEKGWSYHLIILNSLEGTVQIKPYDRESFEQAMIDYSKIEKEAAEGKKIEPVLVSAGPIDTLRRAYPNFFLDIGDFVRIVNKIVSSVRD